MDAETVTMGLVPDNMATEHMGQEVTVRGLVKDYQRITGTPGQPTLILFRQPALVERGSSISDQEIPQTFMAYVTKENTRKWEAASFGSIYKDKVVCVTGVVEEYRDGPAIEVTSPEQLEVDC